MKTRSPLHKILLLLAGVCAALSISGCAGIDAKNQESMLAAAGFHERFPETDKQKELYAAAPSYKVQRVTAGGRVFYAYKDEKKGTAWVGGDAEYQKYQQLALQQRIARENYEAAEMNRDAALGWYGEFGPYVFPAGFRVYHR